jgi:sodium transport system ATP-binding protein
MRSANENEQCIRWGLLKNPSHLDMEVLFLREILIAEGLTKTFRLSAKQQKLVQAKSKCLKAVDNLSFSAYEGEIFGLLGPNGAGKTTTLRILSTLIKADAGNAYIVGACIRTQPAVVRAKIGFLTSELKLEEFFTPNYLFDFFSRIHHIDPDTRDIRKQELFTRFGVDEFAEVKIANLSSGMKQKSSLAISLAHDPNIIIFDEPTNGLDVLTAKVVTDFLLELRAKGKTIIVSTHIFSLIEKICDRVGIIISGSMAACDTLANIKSGRPLEDVFFDLYAEKVGQRV